MESKEIDLLVELIRDVKGDIKLVEATLAEVKSKVDGYQEKQEDMSEMNSRILDMERFRSRLKGILSAGAVFNAAVIAYFKYKGGV